MNTKISTVFFGSGPVAEQSARLLADSFAFEAIITKPATARSMGIAFPGVPIVTVQSRAELDAVIRQQSFVSQFGLLIDFGIIISQNVIDAFALGIINSHFSLLPNWRGADPITFSILSGQRETGVSLMLVTKGMDEGPLLAQAPYNIPADATTPSLTCDLVNLSSVLLHAVVPNYVNGSVVPAPQEIGNIHGDSTPTYSRKLTKDDGRLDWSKPAAQLEREVRAYLSWPHSYTTLAGRDIIITEAQVAGISGHPGEVHIASKHLAVCCGSQALDILRLKPAGKPEMAVEAFLAGYSTLIEPVIN